jgi:tetratricopeptide (TPR) repeat protein
MKINSLPLTIFAVVLSIALFGCTPKRVDIHDTQYHRPQPPATPAQKGGFEPGNRYFYYIEAQLEIKNGRYQKALSLLERAIALDPDSNLLKRLAASVYIIAKDKAKAEAILAQVLSRDPEDIEALVLLGRLQQDRKENEKAKATYEKVIRLDSTREQIYLFLGSLYMEDDQLDESLATFERLVKEHPDAYTGFFFIGKIHAGQGNTKKAEDAFQRTLELAPDLMEPRFELLKLYEKEGADEKIAVLYKEMLSSNPDNVQASLGLGLHYHETGNENQAARLFRELGERSRFDFEIIRNIVQRYLDKEKYEQAIVILEGMLVGAPESSDIHYLLGVTNSGLDKANEAIEHFNRVRPESRFHENAAVHTALLYQEQGNIQEGIRYLKAVIQKVPNNPEYLLYLGSFYEELEDYELAAGTIKKGLAIDDRNPRLHFRLGVIFDKWGKKEASIQAMQTVIAIEPNNANALNYLGYTYADLGRNLDEAEQLIIKALGYKPEDGYITDSLGWVYFKMGRYEESLEVLKKAVDLVPDDPIILEHLGDVYLKLGEKENALKYYHESLKQRKKDRDGIMKKIESLKD